MRFEIEIGRGSFIHQDGTESGARFVARVRVRGGDGTVLHEVRRKSRSGALEAARAWIVKGARAAARIDRVLAPRRPEAPSGAA
jgi:hypothetical protein